eukprot:4883998-Pleurochrysis_carterae.AAC.1
MAATALLAALRERQLEEMVAIEAMYEATVIGTDEASADDQVSAGGLSACCTKRDGEDCCWDFWLGIGCQTMSEAA